MRFLATSLLAAVLAATACTSSDPTGVSTTSGSSTESTVWWVDPPTSVAELEERLRTGGLSDASIADVAAIATPAVILVRRNESTGDVAGGFTQIGGLPLLPPDEPWPHKDGHPLSLVAQLDLDALAGRAGALLPETGLLQFYLDLSLERYAIDLDPVVLWFPEVNDLELRQSGTADWGAEPIPMDFQPIVSVPLYGDRVFASWSAAEADLYWNAMSEPRNIDQIGGWAFEFQFDPVYAVALRDAGLDFEDVLPDEEWPGEASADERRAYRRRWVEDFQQKADGEQWHLLLQLEVTPGDSMWADAGNVWFLAQEDRLLARDFSNVRGELASH